ncbi:MAG: hypothetical protein NT080_00385 [Spirochaetes bacterium]|nr:hypothetical protein [Spirochaetota bacterium]
MSRRREPAAVHVAKGTYRADRHAEPTVDLPVATDAVIPSPAVPESVHKEWGTVTRRLIGLGILIDADLPLLESAFVLLADARYYHELIARVMTSIEEINEEGPENSGQAEEDAIKMLVMLNGMHIKALTLFTSIVSRFAISPSERAKILHALPKGKEEKPKKSIRAILKK